MPAHNILVVVVDGLRASALGAYGNTSFPTPALDHFAADSFLLDWCYATSTDLGAIYCDLWQENAGSLPQQAKSQGYATTLVTDDPVLKSYLGAAHFDHCLSPAASRNNVDRVARAVDIAQSAFARLFLTAAKNVASMTGDSPQLVWLHSRGMYGPWDAPLDLQQSLLEENDLPPIETVTPPELVIGASDDPDVAFRYGCAYAAQAMVLDDCWEMLLDAVDAGGGANRWLVSLVGARGYPLGEHRLIGGIDPRLYGEQLHVPWLIRFPDATGRLARSNQLATHLDLAPSLVEPIEGMSVRTLAANARTAWRDAHIATSAAGHRAIRTADWCLRGNPVVRLDETTGRQGETPVPEVELFVRPDDRWEANDVAKLCPDVVELLTNKLNETP
jgi:arylsulfatase A-like enzyme